MADTARTRAALLVLWADNNTGQISAQDGRDFMVTVMPEEFVNPVDFFTQPDTEQMADRSIRGWIQYSQTVDSAVSFGAALVMTPSNTWKNACQSTSALNPVHGLAGASYAISTTTCQILRRGLIYASAWSGRITSAAIGRPIFLMSGNSYGSWSITCEGDSLNSANSEAVLGYVEFMSDGLLGCWRFDPTSWVVRGT